MGLPTDKIRTAVVVVHGMGQQRPLDTLNGFVDTALMPVKRDGSLVRDYYYSRPAEITKSYEARRYIAPAIGNPQQPDQGDTEIYEYHWSYLMTGNRFGDVLPSTLRLLLRPPWRVPAPLFGAWALIWLLPVVAIYIFGVRGYRPDVTAWRVIGIPVAILLAVAVVLVVRSAVTKSFVDVVRYLDTSPRSYAARREIRGGLVDLLRALHDRRYARIIVVAHSLGGYISYDALMSLWAEMHKLHAGSAERTDDQPTPLSQLPALQDTANMLHAWTRRYPRLQPPKGVVDFYQQRQFALWRELRMRGNPWRVTDFVTVGTPMYLADILMTRAGVLAARKSRALFDTMFRQGTLVRCPPRSETQAVEQSAPRKVRYGYNRGGQQVLGSQSVFAVVRWTNLWFPAALGFFGDWFGGPLHPLFGPGIRDVAVKGNRPGRYWPALAHTKYFKYPNKNGDKDIANHIRTTLDLKFNAELAELRWAPSPNPNTGGSVD